MYFDCGILNVADGEGQRGALLDSERCKTLGTNMQQLWEKINVIICSLVSISKYKIIQVVKAVRESRCNIVFTPILKLNFLNFSLNS